RRSLEALVPGVVVDDHQRWLGHLLVLARTIKTIAAFVLLAVGLSAVATIVFVTRTGLAIHHAVIDLLHLVGAQDSYVARQFETHALFLGLRGGLIGLVFAFATMALLGHLLERSRIGLLPELALSVWEILVIALLPLATGLIAMATARLTVLHSLSRLP
ncbi:MAG: cell division protein FtsX, partial [Kiloniellales bacterium]